MTPRQRLLAPLLLVLFLAVLLLLAPSPSGELDAGGVGRAGVDAADRPVVHLAPGPTPPPGPELLGRPAILREPVVPGGALRVTVRGPGNRLLPDARVLLERPRVAGERVVKAARTDVHGIARFADVPYDGSCEVAAREEDGLPRTWGGDATTVTASDVTLRVQFGLPFEIRPVDAETGWAHEDAVVRAPAEQARENDREVLDANGELFTFAHRGQWAEPQVRVGAPEGFVAWAPGTLRVPISTFATKLTYVYPLRREVDTRVTVLDHEGKPEGRARIAQVKLAGRTFAPTDVEDLAKGQFRIRGLPFFRGEPLEVRATSSRLLGMHCVASFLPTHPADRVEILVELPPPGTATLLSGGHGDGFRGDNGFGSRISSRGGDRTTVRLRVLRHDGTPAAHAFFTRNRFRHRLDENGDCVMSSASPGRQEILVQSFGMLPTKGEVVARLGEEAFLELQEPAGGSIDLQVKDAHGEPLPFARVTIQAPTRKLPYVDERKGVQRLDPFVDHRGRRRFDHVETGTVRVSVWWASRHDSVEIQVEDGKATLLDVVLPLRI